MGNYHILSMHTEMRRKELYKISHTKLKKDYSDLVEGRGVAVLVPIGNDNPR